KSEEPGDAKLTFDSRFSIADFRLSGFLGGRRAGGQAVAVLRAVELAIRGVLFLDRPPPVLVLAVPRHGLGEAAVERGLRPNPRRRELPRGERVARVVPGPAAHEADQALRPRELAQAPLGDLDVLRLVPSADVVGLPRHALLQQERDRRRV